MKTHKTLIWMVVAIAFFSFATAPKAEAFIAPVVAVLSLAAIIGAGGLVADDVVEPDQESDANKDEARKAQKKSPPMESASAAPEPASSR